jgi:phage baseplate assembly protein W
MVATVSRNILYKDFDLNMRMHPTTGKLLVRKNNDAVKQGVRNLVLTGFYERPYNPTFGCNIRQRLFELIGPATEMDVKSDIETAFENHIERAILLDVEVSTNIDGNALNVSIVYRPINMQEPVETTLVLERAR